jgi:thiaminase
VYWRQLPFEEATRRSKWNIWWSTRTDDTFYDFLVPPSVHLCVGQLSEVSCSSFLHTSYSGPLWSPPPSPFRPSSVLSLSPSCPTPFLTPHSDVEACLQAQTSDAFITLSCGVRVLLHPASPSVINIQSPAWSQPSFHEYLIQDGKYLVYYQNYASKIDELCNPAHDVPPAPPSGLPDDDPASFRTLPSGLPHTRLTPERIAKINSLLLFSFDEAAYRSAYQIPYPLDTYPSSSLLTAYDAHYLSQTSCGDILAAAIPCLCLYPELGSNLEFLMPSPLPSPLDPKHQWIEDNRDATACIVLNEALNSLDLSEFPVKPYRTSVQLELNFFGVPIELKK